MVIHQIARIGAVTGISMVVSNVIKPITGTIATAANTVCKSMTYANNSVTRTAETAEAKSETVHITRLMDLKISQREALINYGERTDKLKPRYDGLSEEMKETLSVWEARFPKV